MTGKIDLDCTRKYIVKFEKHLFSKDLKFVIFYN